MADIPPQGGGQPGASAPGGHSARAQEAVGQARAQAQEKTQELAGQAQEKAQELAGQAQERAQQVAGEARGRLTDQLDDRSTEVGRQVRDAAGDLRSMGDQMRQQGRDAPARYVDQAADRVESLGGYLERTDGRGLLNDLEDLARRNPMVVIAGGAALGFAASRLLKASSGRRFEQRMSERYGPTETEQAAAWSSDVDGAQLAPPLEAGAAAGAAVDAPSAGGVTSGGVSAGETDVETGVTRGIPDPAATFDPPARGEDSPGTGTGTGTAGGWTPGCM